MTVKELYDYAKSENAENAEILINYEADDGWYSLENTEIYKDEISINDCKIFIQVYQN